MSEYHGAPGQDVIDVRISIHIVETRTFGTFDKPRLPTDRPKGADRTVHTARNELLGF